jgi:hypothetical protein
MSDRKEHQPAHRTAHHGRGISPQERRDLQHMTVDQLHQHLADTHAMLDDVAAIDPQTDATRLQARAYAYLIAATEKELLERG